MKIITTLIFLSFFCSSFIESANPNPLLSVINDVWGPEVPLARGPILSTINEVFGPQEVSSTGMALGGAAAGAALLGTAAYLARSSADPSAKPMNSLGILLKGMAIVNEIGKANAAAEAERMANNPVTGIWNYVGSWFTADNAKTATVAVGTAVVSNSYFQAQALKYIQSTLTPAQKESIKHEAPPEKPNPTKYDGSYNTPFGTYTLSELLEISQAEAALGKRGPFSEMLLYVLKEQNRIPLDAKKSVS